MEEQILHYYLKVISLFFIFLLFFFILLLFKNIEIRNDYILIDKNQNYKSIIDSNINDNKINTYFYKLILRFFIINNLKIHHGKFKLSTNNFYELITTISNPSNFFEKITIVEGWSKKDLNIILKKSFKNYEELNYKDVIADTYLFDYGSSFQDFKIKINQNLINFKKKYKDNKLLKTYSFNELLIIGSLLEKEGIDYKDKKKIFSVIKNRLARKMKLQIDATVIYALTNGEYNLNRKLRYKDLKVKNEYNTYYIYGLPPKPISYVGAETLDLIFENYQSNYMFYFYNTFENKHIYYIDYNNHLIKLNEYRSKK